MPFKYVEARTVGEVVDTDTTGLEQVMVTVQGADGHMFAALASYICQEIGALRSPYGEYEYVFKNDTNDYITNDGFPVDVMEVEYIFDQVLACQS